jgi:hypothetical protein
MEGNRERQAKILIDDNRIEQTRLNVWDIAYPYKKRAWTLKKIFKNTSN